MRHKTLQAMMVMASGLLVACNDSGSGANLNDPENGGDENGAVPGSGEYSALQNSLFFEGNSGDSGVTDASQLWVSDGTESGTEMIKDIATGGDADISDITYSDGGAYFVADDGNLGPQLWFSDGTESGTEPVSNFTMTADERPENLVVLDDRLFLTADTASGANLYVVEGVNDPEAVDLSGAASDPAPQALTEFNGYVYFVAEHDNGSQIWRSDGNSGDTEQVTDINIITGKDDGIMVNAQADRNLVPTDSALYFNGRTDGETNLWVTTGEPNVEKVVDPDWTPDIKSGASVMMPVGDKLFFRGNQAAGTGAGDQAALKVTDGDGSTTLLDESYTVSPLHMAVVGDTLFFRANDMDTTGNELFKSDGTIDGTGIVANLAGDSRNSSPRDLTAVGDDLYFIASSLSRGLWRTDGTESGTELVSEGFTAGFPAVSFGAAEFLLDWESDDTLYMSRQRGLWRLDDSLTEIGVVSEICPGCQGFISY